MMRENPTEEELQHRAFQVLAELVESPAFQVTFVFVFVCFFQLGVGLMHWIDACIQMSISQDKCRGLRVSIIQLSLAALRCLSNHSTHFQVPLRVLVHVFELIDEEKNETECVRAY